MFEAKFLKAMAERAVKTFFQTFLAASGANTAGLLSADISALLLVSLAASVLSVATSFASASISGNGPSLVAEEQPVKVEWRTVTAEEVASAQPLAEVKAEMAKKKAPAKKATPAKKKPTA